MPVQEQSSSLTISKNKLVCQHRSQYSTQRTIATSKFSTQLAKVAVARLASTTATSFVKTRSVQLGYVARSQATARKLIFARTMHHWTLLGSSTGPVRTHLKFVVLRTCTYPLMMDLQQQLDLGATIGRISIAIQCVDIA